MVLTNLLDCIDDVPVSGVVGVGVLDHPGQDVLHVVRVHRLLAAEHE